MRAASLTATILFGLPIKIHGVTGGCVAHRVDDMETRAGNWSPKDWAKERENNIVFVLAAVASGLNYPAVIAEKTDLCHVTIRECLKVLVADGRVEKYQVGTGKRYFYRAINQEK